MPNTSKPQIASVRLDKWLWAARFFKTRSLAQQAINGGKVRYEGQRSKPGKDVRVGAKILLRQGHDDKEVIVQQLSERRGPAVVAQQLYQETQESQQRRQERQENLYSTPTPHPNKRPDKRDRRHLIAWRKGGE